MTVTRTRSLPDCRPLLAHPDDLTLVFRPIVDLAGATVAGYEALARFPGTAAPDVWFAAAAEAGLRAELEALLVHKALARLPHLPAGTFLLLGVGADLLGSRPVQEAFADRPSLRGLVVEVRDGSPRDATGLRTRGAALAVGGRSRTEPTGATPDVVVLDRDVTSAFAGAGLRAGAGPRVLADGIETPADVDAALRCGAALGRGWLFGLPSSELRPLAPSVAELVGTRDARLRRTAAVQPLVGPLQPAPGGPTPYLELDPDGAPVAFLMTDGVPGRTWRRPVTLAVLPTDATGEVLRRALLRPVEHRYDPVLCTDADGRPLGVLRVAELVRATSVGTPPR